MPADLFADASLRPAAKPLTVFRAELIGREGATWEELFAGFTRLRAITFSSSIEFLVRLADRLDDAEIVFGSESILSKEHLALAQASQTVSAYGFADALADHKALTEALARLLGRGGRTLLTRVVAGSLRFRLLRGRPSHEKLYLLSGHAGWRVVTGSANLSLAAFEGRQQESYRPFDGEPAWALFDGHYQRDWRDSVAIEPDALVTVQADGGEAARTTPLALEEVPIVRVLNAGAAPVDPPARPQPTGFAAEALRAASVLGTELKELALPKDKSGRSVVNAATALRVLRSWRARPLAEASEDRIPRGEIDFSTGMVALEGVPWLRVDEAVPVAEVAHDARILSQYLSSFLSFFGNASGAVEVYWAFLAWLYAAPTAPYFRQASVPVGIDPWVYPVYAVLFGRSSGGKTVFTRVAARSMFGFEKMIPSGQFTPNRPLGLRHRPGNRCPLCARGADHEPRRQHDPAGFDQAHGDLPHRRRDPREPLGHSAYRAARTARDWHRPLPRLSAAPDPRSAQDARRDRCRGRSVSGSVGGFGRNLTRNPRRCARRSAGLGTAACL